MYLRYHYPGLIFQIFSDELHVGRLAVKVQLLLNHFPYLGVHIIHAPDMVEK